MKKILMGALAAAAVLGFASCKDAAPKTAATLAADSLSNAYGEYVGSLMLSDFNRAQEHGDGAKTDFLNGVQMAFNAGEGNRDVQMGLQVGMSMLREVEMLEERENIKIDRTKLIAAFKSSFMQDSMAPEIMANYGAEFNRLLDAAMAARDAEAAAAVKTDDEAAAVEKAQESDNATAGRAFVDAARAADPEIKVTESGLAYKIEKAGEATHPAADADVTVHYVGQKIDGTVFDSSVERGEPDTFNLKQVIPGFSEGIRLVGKGGKVRLYIPGNLGYGERGAGPQIGPDETLIFDVEVIDF
ncbi:FKBP-type peptidyl-prolyl cis-trans isomerase [Muribaculum intestinale]|uniref:FKBP-type peptidyl-prolyl cis-trans isomerase n=1 Tax=Muribaculum intestinale TaxID=1796646 RepID=UPI00352745D6